MIDFIFQAAVDEHNKLQKHLYDLMEEFQMFKEPSARPEPMTLQGLKDAFDAAVEASKNGPVMVQIQKQAAPTFPGGIGPGDYTILYGRPKPRKNVLLVDLTAKCECGAKKASRVEDYRPGHSDWCPVAMKK